MKPEFLAALAAIVLFAVGDAMAAAWGKFGRWWYFALMLVAGNLAWLLFAYLNKSWPLATVSGVVNVGLSLLAVVVGLVVFRERLLPLEKVGLALGLAAITLFVVARWDAKPVEPEAPATSEHQRP